MRSVTGIGILIGLLAVATGGHAAQTKAPAAPAQADVSFTPVLGELGRLKSRVVELERERLALKEDPVFTSSEIVLILSQTSKIPIPAWITKLSLRLDGKPIAALKLTPVHRAVIRESGFLLLTRHAVKPGRHQLQLVAEGMTNTGVTLKQESRLSFEKGAGGLWADLHFLVDSAADEPLAVGIDQWGTLSPAIKKQKADLPYWQAEFALRTDDPLRALSYYGLAQQQGLPAAKLIALNFRMADAYLAANMSEQVVSLVSPYTKQKQGRETLEGWFYLQKAAYIGQNYRESAKLFTHITPKLRVSMYHEALYLAGNSYLRIKEFERAFSTLSQIPRYSKFYAFAQYSMGLAYLNFGDVYSAVESFRRLSSIDADGDVILQQLIDKANLTIGYEFLHQKRYTDAIGQFALLKPSSPSFDQALFGIGWGYFKLEEYVMAAVVFKDLRTRFPGSPYSQEALVALGVCYSRLQAFKLSIDHFRLALDSVTTMAQSIQDRLDTMRHAEWIPPATTSSFPVVSGLSSQVRLDDILKYFQQQQTLQSALEEYQELRRIVRIIDQSLFDLDRIAKSQSQWLSGQESQQRYTLIKTGYEAAKKRARILQKRFKQQLSQASTNLLEQEIIRLEETSVQASIGIARNLVLDTAGLQEAF